MLIYILIIMFLSVCCYLEVVIYRWDDNGKISYKERLSRKVFFVCVYIAVLLYGILRSENIGYDAIPYLQNYFERSSIYSWNYLLSHFEIDFDNGFYLLTKAIRGITADYWVYRGVIYSIATSVYFIIFYKRSKYISISALFYIVFFSSTFYWLRLFLALSVFAIAKQMMRKDKFISTILLIVIAISLHKASIVCIIPLGIRFFSKKRLRIWQVIVLSMGAVGISIPIIAKLQYKSGFLIRNNGGISLLLFYIVMLFLVVSFGQKRNLYEREDFIFSSNMAFLVILVQISSMFVSILTRTGLFFFDDVIFCVCDIIGESRFYKERVYYLSVFIVIFVFYFIFAGYHPEYRFH